MDYAYFISLFLGFILVRSLIAAYVKKLMFLTSGKKVSANPDQGRTKEVKASNKPTFIDYDTLNVKEDTVILREKLVKDAYLLFRKKYVFGLLASAVYLLYVYIIVKVSPDGPRLEEQLVISGMPSLLILYYTGVFFTYRKQFRAEDSKLGYRFELPQITIVKWLGNPRYEPFVTFSFLIVIGITIIFPTESENGGTLTFPLLAKLVFVLVAAVHLGLIYSIKKKSQKVYNIRLLILRVFGDKKQTLMTFGRLIRFWKHFGSWFTVVDPSYIKRSNPMFSFKSFMTLMFIFVVSWWGVPYINKIIREHEYIQEPEIQFTWINLALLVAGFTLYYLFTRFRIAKSFAKDEIDINNKIKKLLKNPRRADLTFKNLPMFCHDNTWKVAVSEFIKNSNVILMDLRGYSDQRKGCEYEVDLILDSIDAKHIVFLVDSVSDKDMVKQLILDRWEYLSVNSPNLNIKNPAVKLFNSMDGKEYDIQTTIDLLIEAANS